jgi:phosphoglycolate phosphatase
MVFDLDGTLADTLSDIAYALNLALERNGLPTHACESYRAWMGDGAASLTQRATPPEAQGMCARLLAEFRELYRGRLVADTRPYPGMVALLDQLAARDVALAVLSNKPHELTEIIVDRLFGRRFRVVLGHREGTPRKPDPHSACEILAELRVAPALGAMVGDSACDIGTAKASGMTAVGATWGYRDVSELVAAGADVCVSAPEQLLGLARQ